MSITEYNGSSIVAMMGEGCVAIAADTRLGIQFQTIDTNFKKIFRMGPRLFIGLAGLATDVQTVYQRLTFRANLFKLREERELNFDVLLAMIRNILYERRFGPFFVDPIIAYFDEETGQPKIANTDLIGAECTAQDFAVGGTGSDELYGMCEALWKPGLKPDQLFEAVSQSLVNAFDRDALSGWGAEVYLIEKDKVTKSTLKTRMD
ncbi:proteasome subunit beta type-3-like isoform X1 [Convolutriloba macropyga]|uniref:proteasome subunit beta type-3-like isoform X1 n=1 Tax=Convolutriloba macropyga TaxID=536237 RepID=UPI003F5257F6